MLHRLKSQAPGLYVHVPFCARACPYCDFDFVVGRSPQSDLYFEALAQEIQERDRSEGIRALSFDTLYLGGGTPSLLGVEGLSRLFTLLAQELGRRDYRELTVEINPEHWSEALMQTLLDHRVNRISLGVQSFDPVALACLGRVHDAKQAKKALTQAVKAGFSVSCDLIVGWPGQSDASLQSDIEAFASCGADHISVYALTIEANTPWTKLVRRGLRVLPDQDRQADALLRGEALLQAQGYQHYEIASYAKHAAQAQHNYKYWSMIDYVGLGPSAHSARYRNDGGVSRRGNLRGLQAWGKTPALAKDQEELEAKDSAAEALWLGLRKFEGVDWTEFCEHFVGVDTDALGQRCETLAQRGILQKVAVSNAQATGNRPGKHAGFRWQVVPEQWLLHDQIAHELL